MHDKRKQAYVKYLFTQLLLQSSEMQCFEGISSRMANDMARINWNKFARILFGTQSNGLPNWKELDIINVSFSKGMHFLCSLDECTGRALRKKRCRMIGKLFPFHFTKQWYWWLIKGKNGNQGFNFVSIFSFTN